MMVPDNNNNNNNGERAHETKANQTEPNETLEKLLAPRQRRRTEKFYYN